MRRSFGRSTALITTQDLSLSFGSRILFENVNLKFTPGNCYGLIGANGAGKSTFLKLIGGEIDTSTGGIHIPPKYRMSVLRQDHFAYNDIDATTAVLMGHEQLFKVLKEKEAIYEKPDFSEADGVRAGELESEFSDLGGWEAESQVGVLLGGLGLSTEAQTKQMQDLDDNEKIKVLLAQALFGDPISCFSTSRQTISMLARSSGWKTFWPTLRIRSSWCPTIGTFSTMSVRISRTSIFRM